MKLLEIFYLDALIFLQFLAENEARTIIPKSAITTEFTEVQSKNGQRTEDRIPLKDKNITQDDKNPSLMEEILLKGGNNSLVKTLLPPDYNKKHTFIDNKATATEVSGNGANLNNITNEALSQVELEKLLTNMVREGFQHQNENKNAFVQPSLNKTGFDDSKLALNITDNTLNFTNSSTNHTEFNPLDVSERHAPILLQIYSTREQDGFVHPTTDQLSVNAKPIGSNETLKQQLDFLQKNAESIKNQQHIVADNGVYIAERDSDTAEIQTVAGSVHLPSSAATSYNEQVNLDTLTKESAELPMPLAHQTESSGKPVNSYTVPNLSSASTKEDKEEVPENTIEDTRNPNPQATQSEGSSTHTSHNVGYIPSLFNSTQKLFHLPVQSKVKIVATDNSHAEEMSLSGTNISVLQQYGIHSIAQSEPSSYNSELAYGPSSNYREYLTPYSSDEPKISSTKTNSPEDVTKDISTTLRFNTSSLSFASNENMSQSSELIYNLGHNDPQQTGAIFLFDSSEYISNAFNTANIEDAFKRLTEIFEEYSVPISSVVKQLADDNDSTQENPILPTRTHQSENVTKMQAFTETHEIADTTIDGITYDGPDSPGPGNGSSYKVWQNQGIVLNYKQTQVEASGENNSQETFTEKLVNSDEDCIGMCAEDSEGEASSFNQPTTTDLSEEHGENNESEIQLNDPSATEYNKANVETTNPAETKLSTTKVMTLLDPTTSLFATYPIANEPANNLEHLEVAIRSDVRKEIENVDKTNETQVATTHHQHFAADAELHAEHTNDKSTAGLQHIGTTLLPQPDTTTIVAGAKAERTGVPKPEVMCSKTEIIKSEQYSKTNGNGSETENETETSETDAGGRVLLGRSLSYTISCHLRKPEKPAAIVRAVQAANITDEIDNNREKIIKNLEQLTITSAADSRNGLPPNRREAEPAARRTATDSSANKASDGAAVEGANIADVDGSGHYDAGNNGGDSADGGAESDENYYTAIDETLHDIDGDTEADGDSDVDVDDYVTSAATLLAANGIQSRVRQAAAMTALAQLTTSLETDNDKTYEYDTRQPLQGGLSDKDVNFASVEHVAASKNTKQTDSRVDGADKDYQDDDDNADNHDDDDTDGNAFIDVDEFVTSDYVTANDSKYREAAKAAKVERNRDGMHVANGAGKTVGVDNMLQYKLTTAEAEAGEEQESRESYNVEPLKIETKSTKLKNARGGVGDANNDASEVDDVDDDGDDGKGESDEASDKDEEMAFGSGAAADLKRKVLPLIG